LKAELTGAVRRKEQVLTAKGYQALSIYFDNGDFDEDRKETETLEEVSRDDCGFDTQVYLIPEKK